MDMQKLSSWTIGRLALLGDAVHPFTPRKLTRIIRDLWQQALLTIPKRPGPGSSTGNRGRRSAVHRSPERDLAPYSS